MTANKAMKGSKGFVHSMFVDKQPVQMRLSSEARALLDQACKKYGMSRTEVIEKLIRGEVEVTPRQKVLLADVLEKDAQLAELHKSNAQVRDLMRRLWKYAEPQ